MALAILCPDGRPYSSSRAKSRDMRLPEPLQTGLAASVQPAIAAAGRLNSAGTMLVWVLRAKLIPRSPHPRVPGEPGPVAAPVQPVEAMSIGRPSAACSAFSAGTKYRHAI